MKILLAIDGSTHSQDAVDEIAGRPWPTGTTVRVVSVIRPYAPPATEVVLAAATVDTVRKQQTDEAEALTARAGERLAEPGLSVETLVREGDARSAILDEAESWDADLIVVGSHGRTGLKRLVLGSVAAAVVAHAHCSVEVVRRRHSR
jgi:nucleotide-binding universal stress UspA family protein